MYKSHHGSGAQKPSLHQPSPVPRQVSSAAAVTPPSAIAAATPPSAVAAATLPSAFAATPSHAFAATPPSAVAAAAATPSLAFALGVSLELSVTDVAWDCDAAQQGERLEARVALEVLAHARENTGNIYIYIYMFLFTEIHNIYISVLSISISISIPRRAHMGA